MSQRWWYALEGFVLGYVAANVLDHGIDWLWWG